MRLRIRSAALLSLALATVSCSDGALNPQTETFNAAPQLLVNTNPAGVRISEIHYDNTGTDAGEAIEVSAPAATDLAGWRVYLYNGSNGASYDNDLLPIVGATVCGDRKVVVLNYAVNGIQNGSPDAVALVDNNGVLVEFLSYEGTFAGVGGPANGVTATDIGISQNGTELLGSSLQRTSSANSWIATNGSNTFGACNDNGPPPPAEPVVSVVVAPAAATVQQGSTQQFVAIARNAAGDPINNVTFTWSSSAEPIATVTQAGQATGILPGEATILATAPNGVAGTATLTVTAPPPPPDLPPVRISEIHYDNFGTDVGEAIEIEGPAGTDLTGWSILLYNGNDGRVYNTSALSGVIDGTCTNVAGRGVAYIEYPSNGIQNGAPDGMALVNAAGNVVEFLSYEGVVTATDGPAAGTTSQDIGVLQNSSTLGLTLQRNNDGSWTGPVASTIGGCNSGGPINRARIISFSGRLGSDPALPVGFEDQLFATLIDPTTGTTIETTFTWSSDAPAVASIDQDGVVRALSAGTAVLRATAADGSTGTHVLPTRIATASTTALYGNHIEFGPPADADNSDDYIVVRPQFISSFNGNKGIPNWAAYNLDPTHFGSEDRCDCFTYDPQLPSAFTRYTTADYTGAGTFHGYGIDRGHLVRSFDREAGSLDNATTFYFSNIIPQAADNNQGPWAAFENYLGAFAQAGSEVYIVAGASGSKGTLKNEGIIHIPTTTWKVAVVMPHDQGLSHVDSYDDMQVFAVIMPNNAGIRSTPWQTYQTTVDAVEALSGYNLLALLPDHIELAVESNTRPPVAVTNGPYTLSEGGTVSVSASGSSDADGHALTFAWAFGDGGAAVGAAASHTYTQDGAYTVRLIATDVLGLADTVFTTANVSNVAPQITGFAGATLLPGESYNASGSFTDPGADAWSATVNYGDGGGAGALALSGQSFTLAHTYLTAGTFTVTVAVSDDDATSTRTASVTVLSIEQALADAGEMIAALAASGVISGGNAKSLQFKIDAANEQLAMGNNATAANQLNALLNEVAALVGSSRLTAQQAQPLRSMITRVIASITR
ncbi:MAG TPA: DNA/RNA non-specific endonuclease [Longimicrobiales bacterium]